MGMRDDPVAPNERGPVRGHGLLPQQVAGGRVIGDVGVDGHDPGRELHLVRRRPGHVVATPHLGAVGQTEGHEASDGFLDLTAAAGLLVGRFEIEAIGAPAAERYCGQRHRACRAPVPAQRAVVFVQREQPQARPACPEQQIARHADVAPVTGLSANGLGYIKGSDVLAGILANPITGRADGHVDHIVVGHGVGRVPHGPAPAKAPDGAAPQLAPVVGVKGDQVVLTRHEHAAVDR